jgi:two-component system LytT family sensor kinase
MGEIGAPLLINVLGHAGGALIFAIFLVLLFSGRGWSGARGRYLPALAAILALVWNLGSLLVLSWPSMPAPARGLVIAVSFSVLSLLPAVLLHLSLKDSQPSLVAAGYLLGAAAVGMHFWEVRGNGATLHRNALLLITVGFLILTAAAVAHTALRGHARRDSGRIAASMCLALFAMSFLHFGAGHAGQAWSSELFIHHAGIPLALFVLLQDYRFILLDAFVRFLANALLAAVLTWFVIEAAFRLVLVERAAPAPLQEALLLISVCLFLVFFAWLRNWAQFWLTHAVFRQGRLSEAADRVTGGPSFDGEERYLDWAASVLAGAVRTSDYAVIAQSELPAAASLHAPVPATMIPALGASKNWSWAEAVVPIRLGQEDSKLIALGRRQGGQRYLGEDLDALGRAAAEIAAKVESLRQQEMNRLVSQAELRALQSQINPHFLFNALNTLYGSIPRDASPARRMVINLAEIFRYFLQSDKTFVPLAEEMEIVRAYLEVEQNRLGSRLELEIHIDPDIEQVLIPVLSIQPLVENAIKHGIAARTAPGRVRITAGRQGEDLRISVENSGSGKPTASAGTGVGLENVKRRLEICYGPSARLALSLTPDAATVEFRIPLAKAVPAA